MSIYQTAIKVEQLTLPQRNNCKTRNDINYQTRTKHKKPQTMDGTVNNEIHLLRTDSSRSHREQVLSDGAISKQTCKPKITKLILCENLKGVHALRGYLEPKTENCFLQIYFDWFIRRMTEV